MRLEILFFCLFCLPLFNCHAGDNDLNELRKELNLCMLQNRFDIETCEVLFRELVAKDLSPSQFRSMYSTMISNSLNSGDYQRAKDFAMELRDKSLLSDDNNLLSVGNKFMGHAESRLGNYKKAIQHYRNALDYNIDSLDVHHIYVTRLCLVYNLVHNQRIREAKKLFRGYRLQFDELRDSKKKHSHIEILFLIAESDILNSENRSDEALQKLIKAQSLFDKNAPILLHESLYHRLVYTHSRRGKYHEVIKASINYKKMLSSHYGNTLEHVSTRKESDGYEAEVFFLLIFVCAMGVVIGVFFKKLIPDTVKKVKSKLQKGEIQKGKISRQETLSPLTAEERRVIFHQIIANISSGQEWHTIYLDYCKLYPNICDELDAVFNGISGINKIIVCCIRLGLSNLDISEYLNLSPRSIESRKYRLIKRYGIRDQKSLKEILATL